ncbi:NAD-dependent succinate-semialdehyde dehydrogenase [Leifsonia xyli]|uniref:NAD-dependent succinate-semialdehyde dehydrogenase n=1 Tax=Leifsonia xyli TaxID=1575 RepID=UPI003D676751
MPSTSYAVINPASGETHRAYLEMTDTELAAALDAAQGALGQWSPRAGLAARSRIIRRVAELHIERRDQLAEIAVREMGKPFEQALGEVDFSAAIYAYYADHAEEFLADEPIELLAGTGTAFVRRAALGVLLGIMPWNYPYYQVARFAAPNLVAGNAILLKPAEQCPESSEAIEQIFRDAGVPDGAYRTVLISHTQVEHVIADPRVQGISVTGSERAGAAVAAVAGRHLKKVVLELGGSDPFILLSTDDLDATVELAVAGRLENGGQACNAAKRFIVQDSLYDEFLSRFTRRLGEVEAADPFAPGTRLGPLSSLRAAELLESQVDRAVSNGATLVRGGNRRGAYFEPTVLTGLVGGNPASQEEFFGPVAQVYRAADEAEAVRLANDTPFGLGSYVFSTDPEQALRVADQLEAGMVFVNAVGAEGAELPFGGVKRSGSGRELGRFGIEEFLNRKLIRLG